MPQSLAIDRASQRYRGRERYDAGFSLTKAALYQDDTSCYYYSVVVITLALLPPTAAEGRGRAYSYSRYACLSHRREGRAGGGVGGGG